MTNKPTFLNRTSEAPSPNYIDQANEQIKKNGTINIDSSTYKNAIIQYNAGLLKGTIYRLDVPEGFCGYIDPNTGEFRVEADPLVNDLNNNAFYPNTTTITPEPSSNLITPYPIDECLENGLPGSYEYTEKVCGVEDGDNTCSGIQWFSGGGDATSDAGTASLSQDICSDGPGINSNTGLAASSPIGGITGEYPPECWLAATIKARELYPININVDYSDWLNPKENNDTGAGYTFFSIGNKLGAFISYDFFFNVNDPSGHTGAKYFKESGLKVTVAWNTKLLEIESVIATKMWEFNPCKGSNCPVIDNE